MLNTAGLVHWTAPQSAQQETKHGILCSIIRKINKRKTVHQFFRSCVAFFYHYMHAAYFILIEQSFKGSKTSLLPTATLIYIACIAVCIGSARQRFAGGGGYRGGFCEKLLEASPMSDKVNASGSKTDPPLAKAKPISDGGSASGITWKRFCSP